LSIVDEGFLDDVASGRALNVIIRYTVKRRLAACRTPEDVRRVFDGSLAIAPKGVRFTPGRLGGVSGEWAEAASAAPKAGALLYLHGGGYVSMSPRTHRAITGGFALRGLRVFAPRLPPGARAQVPGRRR